MQHAVRLALVDSKYLPLIQERMAKHMVYRDLTKPADKLAKADASMRTSELLQQQNDNQLPDDLKLKMYYQHMNKYFTVGDKITDQSLPDIPAPHKIEGADNAATAATAAAAATAAVTDALTSAVPKTDAKKTKSKTKSRKASFPASTLLSPPVTRSKSTKRKAVPVKQWVDW